MQNKRLDKSICSLGRNDCQYNHMPHTHVITGYGEMIRYKVNPQPIQQPRVFEYQEIDNIND